VPKRRPFAAGGYAPFAWRDHGPQMKTPPSLIDCHVHVFDPTRFPCAPDAWYTPAPAETGTPEQLGHVLDAHGVHHALLVGPNSGYGHDNRCLLDTIAQGRGRYKGVGVAFNVALLGVDFYRDTGSLLERLRELGLWAQVQVQDDQLVPLLPLLRENGARPLFKQPKQWSDAARQAMWWDTPRRLFGFGD